MTTRRLRPWALVVCNGSAPGRAFLRSLASSANRVVAADGGANVCRHRGVTPDVIIGDLDSVTPETLDRCRRSLLLYVDRQDNTDLEKALEYLVANGVPEAVIVGADGERIDFTLGNLSILWRYYGRIALTVAGEGWYATPVRARMTLDVPAGTTVSVIPNGKVSGLTLRGFQYNLRNATMNIGEIGVSNVVRRRHASLSVGSGSLLVIVQRSWTPPKTRRR